MSAPGGPLLDASRRRRLVLLLAGIAVAGTVLLGAPAAHAAPVADPVPAAAVVAAPVGPTGPHRLETPQAPVGTFQVKLNTPGGQPSSSITILLLLTVLSVAPALLMLTTSFTKFVVVLSLTRNALGLQGVPPNQVLAGLALFLSLFVMAPTLSAVNKAGVQPYLKGRLSASQAYDAGIQPLRTFMLKQTRRDEIAVLLKATRQPRPATPADVSTTTLIPAFVLSELRSAFLIGFVIFIPFLVIDLVVSSSLMSMGMMMMPPVLVSLPFKLLLFVLVDGWGLVVQALIRSYS